MTTDQNPCNVSGHDWEETHLEGYFTHGLPHSTSGSWNTEESFTVVKNIFKECQKCGRVGKIRKEVGEIHVDRETDELTVRQ